jgi:serine phosphatase RsbU (regulator of sigma subunit)
MLTGVVKSAFHAAHLDGYEPLSVVQRVWGGLAAFGLERFVTLFTALVCPDERQIRYVNAGHPGPVLWSSRSGPVWLQSTGPIVSPALPAGWDPASTALDEGDRLLLYTDGITDVLGGLGGPAEGRLLSLLRGDMAGASLLDAILADVHRELAGQPQPDDFTLLTATVEPSGGPVAPSFGTPRL